MPGVPKSASELLGDMLRELLARSSEAPPDQLPMLSEDIAARVGVDGLRVWLADYQQRFTDNAKKKLYLAYINSYADEGDLNIVGIWYSAIPSPAVQHHLDGGEFEVLMKTNRKANRYLRGVTGYQRGLVANWAGIWNR